MRYRLRTLLIVLALVGVGLAVLGERARRQRIAVDALKAVYAEIQYDCDSGPRQSSHCGGQWIDPNWLHSVTSLVLDAPAVNDDALAHVRWLTHLRELVITEGSEVSSEGLRHLSELASLKRLVLASGNIQDRGLEHIAKLAQLEELDIQNQREITDTGIQRLASLKNLRRFSIENTGVTENGVRRLKELLPGCAIDYSALSDQQTDSD